MDQMPKNFDGSIDARRRDDNRFNGIPKLSDGSLSLSQDFLSLF
jgi:hypothetical protein